MALLQDRDDTWEHQLLVSTASIWPRFAIFVEVQLSRGYQFRTIEGKGINHIFLPLFASLNWIQIWISLIPDKQHYKKQHNRNRNNNFLDLPTHHKQFFIDSDWLSSTSPWFLSLHAIYKLKMIKYRKSAETKTIYETLKLFVNKQKMI